MKKFLLVVLTLISPITALAHPDWKHSFVTSGPTVVVGNVRAFVAAVANIDYAGGGGESWHGVEVRLSLPKKYDGQWVTLLYKDKPEISSGGVLRLGDYIHFELSETERVHLNELENIRVMSTREFGDLYQAAYE